MPNQDAIWVLGDTRDGVYLCADLCYGPHDPTLWPHLYVANIRHLGAISSRPIDLADPLSIMWWNLICGEFISSECGVLDGLGKFRSTRYVQFELMKVDIVKRVNNYHKNNTRHNNWVFHVEKMLVHACSCLCLLSTTFIQTTLCITDFQRCYMVCSITSKFTCHTWKAPYQQQPWLRDVLVPLVFHCVYSKTLLWLVYQSGSSNPVEQVHSRIMCLMSSPFLNFPNC